MSTFPSVIATMTDPLPTQRLNNPSHSSIESAQNDEVKQVQRFVGTLSSAVGTLVYDIRAAASDGGGHVQAANKGGTGQTTYIKGDILVATSTSVLTKVAIGNDSQILQVNSSTASGIQWINNNTAPKVAVVGSVIGIQATTTETSIVSATLQGSTLGTNNAVRTKMFLGNVDFTSGENITFKAKYGTTSVLSATASFGGGGDPTELGGFLEFGLFGRNSVSSQLAVMQISLAPTKPEPSPAASSLISLFVSNPNVNVDSGADQTIGVSAQWSGTGASNKVSILGVIMEKFI